MNKKYISYLIWLAVIPLTACLGILLADERASAFAMLAIAVLALVPPFLRFEKKDHTAAEVMILAALVAFSSLSRIAFYALPGIKPVAAVVVLAGVYLGCEAGFAVGALSALISGFAFGLGSWTPFQMFAWGLVGLLSGVLSPLLKKHRMPLLLYGALSGVLFSLLMDVWTVLSADGSFSFPRFLAAIISAIPSTVGYAISNVLFLLVLQKPASRIFGRLKTRYGVFEITRTGGR